jgi:hypothetical protein
MEELKGVTHLLGVGCYVVAQLFGGSDVDTAAPSWSAGGFAKLSTVYMDRHGGIAALLHAKSGLDNVALRIRGVERTLPPPDATLLRESIFSLPITTDGKPSFDSVRISAVAISNGVPTITVSNAFNGAYSSTQSVSFVWDSARWRRTLDTFWERRQNTWIVGGTAESAVFGTDVLSKPSAQYGGESFPFATDALWSTGHTVRTIRGAIPTGVGVRSFWGYRIVHSDYQRSTPKAIAWSSGRMRDLFGGIAWDSNSSGAFVGDDRTTLGTPGTPVAMTGSRTTRLSQNHGAAFSINDSGTVVGSLAISSDRNAAFVAALRSANRTATLLDSLTRRNAYSITDAYYIADDGSILGLASRQGAVRLVVLNPIDSSHCKT